MCPPPPYWLPHTLTHSYTYTPLFPHTLAQMRSHTHTHTTLSHICPPTFTHSPTSTDTLIHSHTHTLTYPLTHFYMHTHISTLTHTHKLLYVPAHTYQAARLIVVKLHQHTDVSTSPLVLRIHKEPRFLVPEVHVIATASPLPGGTAILGSCEARGPRGAWQAQGPWRGLPAGCLAAALQQLAHGAGLCDRVAGACSSNSKHEGSLPDVCGGREG